MTPIAVFVSGSGTNCEALIRHFSTSSEARVVLVVSSRPDAYALVRAANLGVPSVTFDKAHLNDPSAVLPVLEQYNIGFVVLAGFLPVFPDYLLEAFPRKVVNIHPALLPRFGGKGMYGHKVHEAVKAAGETETGMTVHYVTSKVDSGEIIEQFRVPLSPADTVEDISEKEHQLEMKYFPKVIEKLIGRLGSSSDGEI